MIDDATKALARTCLTRAVNYAKSTWWSTGWWTGTPAFAKQGDGPLVVAGAGREWNRRAASVAKGLICAGVHLDDAEARDKGLRLIDALCRYHKANRAAGPGVWGSSVKRKKNGKWEGQEKVSYERPGWMGRIAGAVSMIGIDVLSPSTREAYQRALAYEAWAQMLMPAHYYATRAGAVSAAGDGQVDEISWEMSVLWPALAIFGESGTIAIHSPAWPQPESLDLAAVLQRATVRTLGGYATAQDLTSRPEIMGWEIDAASGLARNHGRLNADYTPVLGSRSAGIIIDRQRQGLPIPACLGFNAPLVYRNVSSYYNADGTIRRPWGADHGAEFRGCTTHLPFCIAVDALGWDAGADVPAAQWAAIFLRQLDALQSRFAPGVPTDAKGFVVGYQRERADGHTFRNALKPKEWDYALPEETVVEVCSLYAMLAQPWIAVPR